MQRSNLYHIKIADCTLNSIRTIHQFPEHFFNLYCLKMIGIVTCTLIGLPRCLPGLNLVFRIASSAASLQPPPIPLTTSALVTVPVSST